MKYTDNSEIIMSIFGLIISPETENTGPCTAAAQAAFPAEGLYIEQ